MHHPTGCPKHIEVCVIHVLQIELIVFTFAIIIWDNTGDQLEPILVCPMCGGNTQDGGGMFSVEFHLKLGLYS